MSHHDLSAPNPSIVALSRRRLLGLAGATGIGLTLSACGIGGGGTSSSGGDNTGTINALFMKQAGFSEADILAMTKAFQGVNPKIKVNPTFVAYEALHDKTVAAAPAGTYDVVLIDVIWPAEFGSKKIVSDVTSKYPDAWKGEMFGGALQTALYQDKYYGVPWILDTKYFYSNKDLMAKAGVEPASLASWDGVIAAARQMKSKGVVDYPLVWSWSQAEALMCDYTQLLGAFGGKFLSDDGSKAAFNSGGGVAALEFMQMTLKDKLSNPSSTQALEEDVRKVISQGQAAFALNWTYMFGMANDPKESQVVGKLAIGQTPSGPAGRPGVNGSMALAVSAGSKNQKAAWTYIEFLTSQDQQNKYAKDSLPVWKSSYTDPAVIETNPQTVAAASKQLDSMILRPTVPNYNAVSQKMQAEIQKCLLGSKTAQQALDDAAKAADDILAS